MHFFYDRQIVAPRHTLSEVDSRHCIKVLRMKSGDQLVLTDGRGNIYHGVVTLPDSRGCIVGIERKEAVEPPPYQLWIAVAPTKNMERFEWFVEKATEIGCSRITPLECERSERRRLNTDRLHKIMVSALKQSTGAWLPQLDALTPLGQVITSNAGYLSLMPHCEADRERTSIGHAVAGKQKILIIIGPEGDFSPEEINFALENNFTGITLGPNRLRTETAAVLAVSTVSVLNSRG